MMDVWGANAWWVLTGLAVLAELLTGTVYLLMIALGLAAGALSAMGGLGGTAPLVVAAVVGAGCTGLWHWRRAQHPRSAPPETNRDVNLDIGELVLVSAWGADGVTQVSYRGSSWRARLAPGAVAAAGWHRITAVEANTLVLSPQAATVAAASA